ncbi:hypothetical protein [Agromyces sp. Marseille-Q5079]|uniref:hypothetical protein n=1 Tax=Agromyces sp. Marseille-Q5079 TaxID=3439059 RepID=UPI003D9CAC4B
MDAQWIDPPPHPVLDGQLHLYDAANAEHRNVSAFWAQFDQAPESPSRWSDASAAYWRSAGMMPARVTRRVSMYR